MKARRQRPSTQAITFRSLVRDCAEEPELVESFNRAYGARLKAPITALLEDRWPLSVNSEEEMHIGCFIVFVHEQIWLRMKRAQSRIGTDLQPPVG